MFASSFKMITRAVAPAIACCSFACLAQNDAKPDLAVEAALKIGITVPVQAREWHIWWGAPLGADPSIPAWEHWKGLKRFGKFDPTTTIEDTVPGSAWRRYLNCVGYPLIGPYDAGQDDVIRWQLETARNAGLDCLHIHLWPALWDNGTDMTPLPIFDKALSIAEKLKYPIAVHDEIMFRKMSHTKAQQLENTISRTATLVKQYGSHPGWKKMDGLPVYYFQNSNKWLSAKDMETYMSEVEKKAGPVYWIVEMGASDEYLRIPQIKMLFGPNVSWFLHTPPFGVGPHPWEDVRKDLFRSKELAKKYGKKFGILVYAKFNNNNDRGEPGKGRMDAEDGNFYIKSLSMAKEVNPDLIIVTQWNDFEEGAFIEPAWDYDGFNGDPFRYCRITASSMGKTFSPAPLPKRDQLDPLIRHKLFGDTVAGDAGPVFQSSKLADRKLEWKWCEGSGDPVEMRIIQSNLLRWTPDSPAMGPIRVSNLSQIDEKGTLKDKMEFRFYVPGMICDKAADLWIGVRASSAGSLRIQYRSEMENYRVDSRWEKRYLDTGRSAFIEVGEAGKVYWMPMRGVRFSGWEGDMTLSANGNQACELMEILIWNPSMKEVSIPASWDIQSGELAKEINPLKPFVACAYDKLGNAGLPRLFHNGKTTISSAKDPMDLLKK
ncbi:MAG TPA: hypothetical protein DET40_22215 [Lentisphaeria bacterium]|nr:MAG: hypothetical protein A2X45_04300 [Lentisphaerae bacterium GWF2_50_93]HCE46270.1 hypothetical protein [Lentisphaeria bacterium]